MKFVGYILICALGVFIGIMVALCLMKPRIKIVSIAEKAHPREIANKNFNKKTTENIVKPIKTKTVTSKIPSLFTRFRACIEVTPKSPSGPIYAIKQAKGLSSLVRTVPSVKEVKIISLEGSDSSKKEAKFYEIKVDN